MSQKAKWMGKTQSGETAAWAGDGSCSVLGFDDQAAGFGVGDAKAGPAVLVQFDVPGKYTALVSPSELQQVE